MTLLTRLYAKIDQSGGPEACWPWRGALTTSRSRRNKSSSKYGAIQEGGRGSKIWRAHRLMLLLATCPDHLHGAELLRWIYLADRQYAAYEVAHQCDQALCCNPAHLAWETHLENVQHQIARQRAQGAEEAQAVEAVA